MEAGKDLENREHLVALLDEEFIMSLATNAGDGPHSTPLFYAFDPHRLRLIFVSDPQSKHSRHLEADPAAAASVYCPTDRVAEIRGVQLRGRGLLLTAAGADGERERYMKRFPFAGQILEQRSSSAFYAFAVEWAKITDNRRGFGFKTEFAVSR